MEIPPVFGSSAMLERLEQHLAMIRPLQGLLERVSEALGDAVGHAESEAEPGDDDILDDLVEAAERVNEVPGESRMALGAAALRAASGGRARARAFALPLALALPARPLPAAQHAARVPIAGGGLGAARDAVGGQQQGRGERRPGPHPLALLPH